MAPGPDDRARFLHRRRPAPRSRLRYPRGLHRSERVDAIGRSTY